MPTESMLSTSCLAAAGAVVIGAFAFIPSFVVHFRRASSAKSIGALNALVIFLAVMGAITKVFLFAAVGVWIAALAMAVWPGAVRNIHSGKPSRIQKTFQKGIDTPILQKHIRRTLAG